MECYKGIGIGIAYKAEHVYLFVLVYDGYDNAGCLVTVSALAVYEGTGVACVLAYGTYDVVIFLGINGELDVLLAGVYHDINQIEAEGVPGEDAVQVIVDSTAGNIFKNKNIISTLTCTVYSGTEDITSQVTKFTWKKKKGDGTIDEDWSRLAAGRTITIGPEDVSSKAIFICEVEF